MSKSFKPNPSWVTAYDVLRSVLQSTTKLKATSNEDVWKHVLKQKRVFSEEHPTNPFLRNAFRIITEKTNTKSPTQTKTELLQRMQFSINHISTSHEKIAEYGYKKIKKGMVIFVPNYSSSVIALLLKAHQEKIHFEVVTTEASPFFSGCLLANILSHHKIPVTFYSDLALRIALKQSDLVLMGADTISQKGQIIATIGSELIAEVAHNYDVPVYICMDSWKVDDAIITSFEHKRELLPAKELWNNAPHGVSVMHYAFEKVHPKLISGIITERGIHKPQAVVSEAHKH